MPADLNVGRVIAHLELDARRFKAALAQATGTLQSAANKMKDVGRTMTTSITLPLVAAGTAQAKTFTDFESNLSKIVGLVGVASESVENMGESILEMATRVGKGPRELSDALFFVTSAGLRGAEAMETLQVSARGAAAGLGETKIVADAITSAINAYGSANITAAQAGDILVATVREGKAEADELAQVFGRLLPMAANLGVGLDQLGAGLAAMTRIGLNAQESSTALRGALNLLAKQGIQGKQALESVGLSAEGLRRQVREEGLLATLTTLSEKLGGAGDAFFQVFPNVRALTGVLSLTGKNAEKVKGIFDALANSTGALDYAFEEASKTAEFQLKQVMASLEVGAVRFGKRIVEIILPALRAFVRGFTTLGEQFFALSVPMQQMIVGFTALVAAAGPMIWILSSISNAMITVGSNMLQMTASVISFAAAWGAPLLIIGALGLAIWVFRDEVKVALESIANIWTEFITWLESNAVIDWTGMLDTMLSTLGEWGGRVAQIFEEMSDRPGLYDALQADLEELSLAGLEEKVTAEFGKALNAAGPIIDKLKAKLESVKETILAWGAPLDASKLVFAEMEAAVAAFEAAMKKANAAMSETNETAQSIKGTITSAFAEMALAFRQGAADFATFVESVVSGIIRIIAEKTALLLIEIAIAAVSTGGISGAGGIAAIARRVFVGGSEDGLQHGGIVRTPRRALIGEVPEAVIPLHKLGDLVRGDMVVHIENNAPVSVSAEEGRTPSGDQALKVVINAVADNIARRGVIGRSFESSYTGVQRRGKAR
jgi:TP901 family phage tail tape measure protein